MTPNNRGALIMVLAMAGFAIEDALIKVIGTKLPPGQIIALIGCMVAPVLALMLRSQGLAIWPAETRSAPVILRNAFELIGTFSIVTALTKVDLSTIAAILQATPLVVTLGAVLFLGETVGWRRWAAMIVGFAGILVILRPGLEGFDVSALWAVSGMLGLAFRDIATRRIPDNVHALQLTFQAFAFSIPVGCAALLFISGPVQLDGGDWLWMIMIAALGLVSYWVLVLATRTGEVSFVTPFRYSRMLFALTIGIAFFHERPDVFTWIGIAMIIGAGLFSFLRERKLSA